MKKRFPKKDDVFFGKEQRKTEKRAARETSGERNCLVATRPSTTEPGLSVRLGDITNIACVRRKLRAQGIYLVQSKRFPKKDEVFFGKEERQTEKRAARETSGERYLLFRQMVIEYRTRLIVLLGIFLILCIFYHINT